MLLRRLACVLAIIAAGPQALAQPTAATRAFTLAEALAYAADHSPAAAAAIADASAASSAVTIARAASLPRLDTIYQLNRATFNNTAGLLLPQSVVPGLSGPPLPESSSQTVWGTALGALLTWEPFDFGSRAAGVVSAEAGVGRARAAGNLTRLDVERAVAASFLAVALADEAVRAADADLQRRGVVTRAVKALVDAQLRPGADASRAEAERAAAETRTILAKQTLAIARAEFTRFLGYTEGIATTDARGLLEAAPFDAPPASAAPAASHPVLQVRQAAIDFAQAQKTAIDRAFRPRLLIQSGVAARGSGVLFNGTRETGASGLGLDRMNWVVGVQAALPNPFEITSRRAKLAAADAQARAEHARYDEARLQLVSQQQAAAAMVDAARAVAATIPAQLAAAREAEGQARARYDAGLASLVEVADTQNLLAQAEYQSAIAHIDAWRALLAQAIAQGDVAPFAARAAAVGGRH